MKTNIKDIEFLQNISREIRCSVVSMVSDAKVGHIGGSLSITDILVALYFRIMDINPSDPEWGDRDRLVLSKGHAATALYSTLAARGFISKESLKSFGCINSNYQVHPDKRKIPGIEASTGALGQGLSIGIGIALAARLNKKKYHTYVILGDGESQEGQVWEAAMFAAHYGLNNLTAITDKNNVQLMGNVPDIMGIDPLDKKWSAFGWDVIEINGHDFGQIIDSLERAKKSVDKPVMIIANTVKGKGVSFMQNTCKWHGSVPTGEEYEKAIAELNKPYANVPGGENR
jgi:transketolase